MSLSAIQKVELVRKLADVFDEVELTSAEVDEALREAGYDPDKVSATMRAIANRAMAEQRLRSKNEYHAAIDYPK